MPPSDGPGPGPASVPVAMALALEESRPHAALRRLHDRFEVLTAALGTSSSAGLALAGAPESAEHVLRRADPATHLQKRYRA